MMDSIQQAKKIKRTTLIVSVALFVLSLTQKCYCTTNECGDSILVFLVGWMGLGTSGAAIAWLANPVLLVSWIFIKKNSISLVCSIGSLLICLSFLFFKTIIDDEAGHYNRIVGYKSGYWLWVISSLAMLTGNLILKASDQKKRGQVNLKLETY